MTLDTHKLSLAIYESLNENGEVVYSVSTLIIEEAIKEYLMQNNIDLLSKNCFFCSSELDENLCCNNEQCLMAGE